MHPTDAKPSQFFMTIFQCLSWRQSIWSLFSAVCPVAAGSGRAGLSCAGTLGPYPSTLPGQHHTGVHCVSQPGQHCTAPLESVSLLPRPRSRDQWRLTFRQLSLHTNNNQKCANISKIRKNMVHSMFPGTY